MKRIVLLAINARYVHSNLALLYIQKYIASLCPGTVIIERGINETDENILSALREAGPGVVAVSVYIWNTLKVKRLIPLIREHLPGTIIVLGGPEVSYNRDSWSGASYSPDYIVAGAGEAGFMKLAGSGFSLDERVIREKNPPLAEIPFPYNSSDVERLAGRFLYYESSRGCPFRCSYCLSSREDQRLDLRPVNMVCDELDFLSSFRPGLLKFVDRTFNSRKDHYRPVWEHIVKKCAGSGTVFHFEVYPGLLDDDDLSFLASVPGGLFQFEIGLQSFTPAALGAVHRVMESNTYNVIEKIISGGNIHVHLDLIAGLPYEDYAGFGDSFNRVMSLSPDHFQPGILKVLPGTEMMEHSGEYKFVYSQDPPYAVKQTAWIDSPGMEKITAIAGLVERIYNSGRFRAAEKWLAGLYSGSFEFYEKLAGFHSVNAAASHWEGIAALLLEFMRSDIPENVPLLRDHLRWDWCCTGTVHHYPEVIRSEITLNAKKRGYNYITGLRQDDPLYADAAGLSRDELRRSIFFTAETAWFREKMMKGGMAMFLPDKHVIFFDLPDFIK